METHAAVVALRDRLDDRDLYYFQPDDVEEKFFLDSELVRQGAEVLLIAFLSGMASSVKDRSAELGKGTVD
jgi:hypothetical protein